MADMRHFRLLPREAARIVRGCGRRGYRILPSGSAGRQLFPSEVVSACFADWTNRALAGPDFLCGLFCMDFFCAGFFYGLFVARTWARKVGLDCLNAADAAA